MEDGVKANAEIYHKDTTKRVRARNVLVCLGFLASWRFNV